MTDINKTELYIIKGLLLLSDYCSKFIEKVQPSSFSPEVAPIVKSIKIYYAKYNKAPTIQVLCDHMLPKAYKGDESLIEYGTDVLVEARELPFSNDNSYDFLVDETKKFIKRSAIEDAIIEAMSLVESGKMDEAVSLITEANAISFDESLGHDYFEDLKDRVLRMKSGEDILLTGMSELDKRIGGGWHKKSLNIFGAETNAGKTLIMSDITLKLLAQGYNGLYVTLEIYEDLLANRIDANLADISLSNLVDDPDLMMSTLMAIKDKRDSEGNPFGRLIIKYTSPGCMNSNGLLALIRELQLKRNGFKPDFIMVDYIGLLVPNNKSFSDNTYGKLKTVAEELRAVGSTLNVPVFSAVQVNRDAFGSPDIGLENTSDSMGIPMTADVMIMITRDKDADIMKWFIAKSRFSKNGQSFVVDVVYDKMRLSCTGDSEVNTEDDLVKVAKSVRTLAIRNANIIKKDAKEAKEQSDKIEDDNKEEETDNEEPIEVSKDETKNTNRRSTVTTSSGVDIKF